MQKITDNIYFSEGGARLLEDGRTTECKIDCRLNLREVERQYFIFTKSFIKNRISRRIPVVYSIFSLDHRTGVDVCRAKYLLTPFDGKAVVMHIDRNYYFGVDSLPSDRDVVRRKDVLKPNPKKGEYSEWSYTETITVTAQSKCHKDDKFDVEIGRSVARLKAVKKALRMVCGLYMEITAHARQMFDDMFKTEISLLESIDQSDEILKNFADNDGVQ